MTKYTGNQPNIGKHWFAFFRGFHVNGPWSYCFWIMVADYTMDGACGRGDQLIFPLLGKERETQEGWDVNISVKGMYVSNDLNFSH